MIINDDIKNITGLIQLTGSNHPVESQKTDKTTITQKKVVDKNKNGESVTIAHKNSNTEKSADIGIRLEVDSTLHIVVAKIIDKESEDVIRQIPPAEIIKISKALKELNSKRRIDTEV